MKLTLRELEKMGAITFLKGRFYMNLPGQDEYGTPLSELPNCPKCGAAELAAISARYVKCYLCGTRTYYLDSLVIDLGKVKEK